jgi:hypothetical protein
VDGRQQQDQCAGSRGVKTLSPKHTLQHCVYEDACIECYYIIGARERAKHIDIRKHFAHEVIHMRLIRVPTGEQLADIFTKVLPLPLFERCLIGIMGGDLKPKGPRVSRWVEGQFSKIRLSRLSHVDPSEGCLTVLQYEGPSRQTKSGSNEPGTRT